jgi:hypothetical protein
MNRASAAFADEMSKIASRKLRVFEGLAGAAAGAGLGGLGTKSEEGAITGAILGSGATMAASRISMANQMQKRLKKFLTTKQVADSAQRLAEGPDVLIGLQARLKGILDDTRQAQKARTKLERVWKKKYHNRGVPPPFNLQWRHTNLEEFEKQLKTKQLSVQNMIDMVRGAQANREKAHQRLLDAAEGRIRKEVQDKLFGVI